MPESKKILHIPILLDVDGCICKNDRLPASIEEDRITLRDILNLEDATLVVGYRTYVQMGKLTMNKHCVILTDRGRDVDCYSGHEVHSYREFRSSPLSYINGVFKRNVVLCGGLSVYELFDEKVLPYWDIINLYISIVSDLVMDTKETSVPDTIYTEYLDHQQETITSILNPRWLSKDFIENNDKVNLTVTRYYHPNLF